MFSILPECHSWGVFGLRQEKVRSRLLPLAKLNSQLLTFWLCPSPKIKTPSKTWQKLTETEWY
ncbi:MAG: hypothetical protein RLP02_00175 [Coleofasciculus sp. C2-GNP5-27]